MKIKLNSHHQRGELDLVVSRLPPTEAARIVVAATVAEVPDDLVAW